MKSQSDETGNDLRVEIAGASAETLTKIFGNANPQWGDGFQPLPEVKVVNRTEEQRGLTPLQQFIDFTISYGSALSANLLAAWLYDCIKGTVKQLRINGKEISVDKEAIERAIEKNSKNN